MVISTANQALGGPHVPLSELNEHLMDLDKSIEELMHKRAEVANEIRKVAGSLNHQVDEAMAFANKQPFPYEAALEKKAVADRTPPMPTNDPNSNYIPRHDSPNARSEDIERVR